jgi:hypothetical protein
VVAKLVKAGVPAARVMCTARCAMIAQAPAGGWQAIRQRGSRGTVSGAVKGR